MLNKATLKSKTEMIQNLVHSYYKNHFFFYPTPMTVTFLVTNRCHLRCKHCFNSKLDDDGKELTLSEYELLTNNMGNISSALLCGGEPFIRNDFHQIVYLLRKKCNLQFCSTSTNGQFTDSIISQTEKIVTEYPDRRFVVNVSIDGFEEQHDALRGNGVYSRAINTISELRLLRKYHSNLQIGIVSTLNTFNENNLDQFFAYISKEAKPDVISLLLARQMPRDGEYIKRINSDNYEKAKKMLYELFKDGKNGNYNSPLAYFPFGFYDSISRTLRTGKRGFYCYAGKHGAYIDYDGTVNVCEIIGDSKCSDHPLTMGNLRDYDMDFKTLWNSENAMKVRAQVNCQDCCKACTHETEGLLPSIYFEPNSRLYLKRIENNLKKADDLEGKIMDSDSM